MRSSHVDTTVANRTWPNGTTISNCVLDSGRPQGRGDVNFSTPPPDTMMYSSLSSGESSSSRTCGASGASAGRGVVGASETVDPRCDRTGSSKGLQIAEKVFAGEFEHR